MYRIRQSKGSSLTEHVVWRSPNSNADTGTSGDLRELVKRSGGLDCGNPPTPAPATTYENWLNALPAWIAVNPATPDTSTDIVEVDDTGEDI
jgi:hypothetical protein